MQGKPGAGVPGFCRRPGREIAHRPDSAKTIRGGPIAATFGPQALAPKMRAGKGGTDEMNSRSGFVELGVTNEGLRAAPIVSETYWGYVIRPAEPFLERAALVEILATFSGVLVFMAAYGQWLLPGSDLSISVVPLKLVSTVIFVVLGATLVWIGRMGMVQELHVDRLKAELRLVQRNRSGHGRLVGQIAFREVSSVVLLRSRTPVLPSRLSIRLAGEKGQVDLLPSDEEQLLPIRDRLISDLSPRFRAEAAEPQRRRRTATS